jgi:hypothetical protein
VQPVAQHAGEPGAIEAAQRECTAHRRRRPRPQRPELVRERRRPRGPRVIEHCPHDEIDAGRPQRPVIARPAARGRRARGEPIIGQVRGQRTDQRFGAPPGRCHLDDDAALPGLCDRRCVRR